MTALLRLQEATLAFGTAPVLDQAELTIQPRERICIVGRNGAGKSSLLRVLAGQQTLDSGQLQQIGHARVAMLPQDPPTTAAGTVYRYVSAGLAETGALLERYQVLSRQLTDTADEQTLNQLSEVQQALEAVDGWQLQTHIEQVLSRLELQPDTPLAELSGGWLRRVALARALANKPDLLLLDEPTNHLDITTVSWLEQLLLEFTGALVFISHDRAFIRALATRIIDLDRGQLRSFPGDYERYLTEKEHVLQVEAEQAAAFDKKLAQEERWIRQGIKARRTRNEGRVRELQQLRQERAQRREQQGQVRLNQQQDSERSGKQVFVAEQLCLTLGEQTLVRNLDLIIQRGDKVALVGPNGCGKSTFIKLLLGQIAPTAGSLKIGTGLQIAYFDQYRAQLDPSQSVADNVADGKQEVTHQGRTRHIYSYLQDFLFTPQQARMPLSALSGGEKNRVLLARILLQPANLLVLDEPTNDLDIPTLELLEQLVSDYPGTVLLVSHDREFIENTATSVLWFAGQGQVVDIVGGYQELVRYQNHLAQAQEREQASQASVQGSPSAGTSVRKTRSKQAEHPKRPKKLSQKLQRELTLLPERLEQLEADIDTLQAEINEPTFFQQPTSTTQPVVDRLTALEEELEAALERWEYLEQLQEN